MAKFPRRRRWPDDFFFGGGSPRGANTARLNAEASYVTIPVAGTAPSVAVAVGQFVYVNVDPSFTGGPHTYSATGMPSWMSINPRTGALSGPYPMAGFSGTVTVTATNVDGSANVPVVFSLPAVPVSAGTPGDLPGGSSPPAAPLVTFTPSSPSVGSIVTVNIAAAGATSYSFSMPGVTVSGSGATRTFTAGPAGAYAWTATATGPGGTSPVQSGTLTVAAGGGGGPVLNRNVKILAIGDSTTYGVGADPTGATDETGAFLYSYPAKLRDYLAAQGHAALQQSFAGDGSGNIAAYRSGGAPTLTLSSSASSKSPTLGEKLQRIGSGQSCTFQATVDVDTVEFTLYNASGFGTGGRLLVDGVPHSTYNTAAVSDSYVKYTVTGLTPGLHLFTFDTTSGLIHGPGFLNAWRSTVKSFQVINAGARNWTTTQMAGAANPASPRNAIAVVAPDIVLINAGINDYRQGGTTIATVTANIQAIITAAEVAGAVVVLVVPTPVGVYSTVTDAWSQSAVLTMYQGLAAANPNTVLVNTPEVLFNAGLSGATNPATYAALSAAGHMYDTLHPKTSVYTAEANAVGAAVLSIATAKGWIA